MPRRCSEHLEADGAPPSPPPAPGWGEGQAAGLTRAVPRQGF